MITKVDVNIQPEIKNYLGNQVLKLHYGTIVETISCPERVTWTRIISVVTEKGLMIIYNPNCDGVLECTFWGEEPIKECIFRPLPNNTKITLTVEG